MVRETVSLDPGTAVPVSLAAVNACIGFVALTKRSAHYMKAAAWAAALDLKNAGAALFEPDLDHLNPRDDPRVGLRQVQR
jgi:hypothetical protein